MSKRALICGIAGQDGAYLAKLLLALGYEVIGTSRDASSASFSNLNRLGIAHQVINTSMAVNDFRSVLSTLRQYRPDEVYNLAGQTSVGLSFEQPVETIESIATGTLNMLEAVRFTEKPVRFYSAGSGECFGDTGENAASETTPFRPKSPYAIAKATAHNLIATYREAYQMYACTGVLFNHESALRPERFVTQKIVRAASRIAGGSQETLLLGNIDIVRDWGWAPEYVEAMWRMLQQPSAKDYVIATGSSCSLRDFVIEAFKLHGLDWSLYVKSDDALLRPADHLVARADPSLAARELGWSAKVGVEELIRRMTQDVL